MKMGQSKQKCKIKNLIVTILLGLCVLLAANVHSAVMPEFEILQPIDSKLSAPTSVALDSHENIYVTQSIENKLIKFSQSGAYIKTLNGLSEPLGIAVDQNGRIYVGNKAGKNVAVYDAGFTFLFKLGAGDGEISQPTSIAIYGELIYVADSKEDMIKVYNPDGSFYFSFGSTGGADGQFNFPTSIAVDEISGEIIVLDRQHRQSWMGDGQGARIQVFDMNGVFKRSFGEYGIGDGKLNRAVGVTVDNEGRIYATDTFQQLVQVFDSNGIFLGTITDLNSQFRTPLGLVRGKSNRLFIASLFTGKVEVYGLDQYTQMEVTPSFLSFATKQNNNTVPLKDIQIINNGKASLNWTATSDDSWITISAAAGSAEPTEISTTSIGMNLDGLAPGTYSGSVNISAETGPTEVVDIELTIEAIPTLSVAPSSLVFTSLNGSVPLSQGLSISDSAGVGSFDWSASSNVDWIVLSKETGTAPDSITVSVDVSSFSSGTYFGEITVTADDAMSSHAIIPVTLTISDAKGKIKVKTNLKTATFTINGPVSYSGSGKKWKIKDAPEGTYFILFEEVEGYISPDAQSKTLEANGKITFEGEYIGQEKSKGQKVLDNKKRNIITGAGSGEENAGIVKVFNSDGTEPGVEFLAHQYGYGVNVAAGDINSDGFDEIITAPGPGPDNPSEINIFDRTGYEITGLSFTANEYMYGAHVATGDLNCDGFDEVIVGAGAGAGNPAEVRVFVYDPFEERLIESGINFNAYDSKYGVRVTAGHMECGKSSEIITVPGEGDKKKTKIRIWKVDTSFGPGKWSVALSKEMSVKSRNKNNMNIASSDINADGYDEIITGSGSEITIFDGYGDKISEFEAGICEDYGCSVASGDLDGDGAAELVAGAGSDKSNTAKVMVFDPYGNEIADFDALDTGYGINLAIGYLGLR
jgi:sugar lactone lactonase YvrE